MAKVMVMVCSPMEKARQAMKLLYGTKEGEGWTVRSTPGATNYVKKGPIRYVFVEVTSPPPSLDALNRQLAEKGRNGTTDILKGNTFRSIKWEPDEWPHGQVDMVDRAVIFSDYTAQRLQLGNQRILSMVSPRWRAHSQGHLVAGQPRALSSVTVSPEMEALSDEETADCNNSISLSLSRSLSLSFDPEAPSSPRPDQGRQLANVIQRLLAAGDGACEGMPPFADGHGALEFTSESEHSTSDQSMVIMFEGHPGGYPGLDKHIHKQLVKGSIEHDRFNAMVETFGPSK